MSGNVNNTSIVLLTNKPKLNTLSFEGQKTRDYFLGKPISGQDTAALKSKDSGLGRKPIEHLMVDHKIIKYFYIDYQIVKF
jgi:hypothetical protein